MEKIILKKIDVAFRVKAILVLFSLLYLLIPVSATNISFLEANGSARCLGLGNAYSSVANGTDALLWNSAGLAEIQKGQLQVMYSKDYYDIGNAHLMAGFSLTDCIKGGIGYVLSGADGIIQRSEDKGLLMENTSFRSQAIFLGLGMRVTDGFNIGSTIKYIRRQYVTDQDQGLSLDLGISMKIDEQVKLSMVVQDINSPKIGIDEFQPNLICGLKLNLLPQIDLMTDLSMTRARSSELNLGSEWHPLDIIVIRGGFQAVNLGYSMYRIGMGLDLNGLELDYAFVNHPLDPYHRLTMGLKF